MLNAPLDFSTMPGVTALGKGNYGQVWQVPVSTSSDLLRLIGGGRAGSLEDQTQVADKYYRELQEEGAQYVIVKCMSQQEDAEIEIEMTQAIARATMVDEWTGCRFIGAYHPPDTRHGQQQWRLVMKPVQSERPVMNLEDYLDQQGSLLTDQDKESLARDLVDIVKYFNEDKKIGLLDLKAPNFLVVQHEGRAHLKLIDPGLATHLDADRGDVGGSPHMMP